MVTHLDDPHELEIVEPHPDVDAVMLRLDIALAADGDRHALYRAATRAVDYSKCPRCGWALTDRTGSCAHCGWNTPQPVCVCPPDYCIGTDSDSGMRVECAACLQLDPWDECLAVSLSDEAPRARRAREQYGVGGWGRADLLVDRDGTVRYA